MATPTPTTTSDASNVFVHDAPLRIVLMSEAMAAPIMRGLTRSPELNWDALVTLKILLPDRLARQLRMPISDVCDPLILQLARNVAEQFVTREEARLFM